jgi:2'-5' RNA ligase
MNEKPLPTPALPRLFIAIDLPSSLTAVIQARCHALTGIRWSAPQQRHLTLAFIGPIDPEQLSALDERLQQIVFAPFALSLDRIGSFNHRLLWLGCERTAPLAALHQEITQILAALQLANASRPFIPHVTLGKALQGTDETLAGQLEAALLPAALTLNVDRFALKSSTLTAQGPIHRSVRVYTAGRGI